ncbi:SLC13 family permease [Constantimarinum furrinae]|uniref:Potassium transporter TrkA n=1 Tax=Constantimarinum furrinae TaxID=2562285 RepID=A0A7G8PVQ3_9FLAO|nr:SLC13 family permease [Constantimarinum furrinae]QNJ98419.1 potassium transporter TrkA [Constantimarinum furrinae]
MGIEILLVFAIIGITVLLFITELIPIDKIGFFVIVSLVLLGLTTPEEAVSGFSNSATITILMLMILAIGLEDNGVITLLSNSIKKLSILPLIALIPVFMVVSATISSFISTTAVVIIFIKIIAQLSEKYNFSTSKLLMPISFAGILGGSCTLMGTSTNLLVNSIARDNGLEAFSFFEFTKYGLILLIVGVVFMTIASKWLPKENKDRLPENIDENRYLFTLSVTEESVHIGKPLSDVSFYDNNNVKILKLLRNDEIHTDPGKNTTLRRGDQIIIMSDLNDFATISKDNFELVGSTEKFKFKSSDTEEEEERSNVFVELLILPGSDFIGKSFQEIKREMYHTATALGIQKQKMLTGNNLPKALNALYIKPGDKLMVQASDKQLENLYNLDNMIILRQHESNYAVEPRKRAWSIISLLTVIALASTGVLPILASALTGVGMMLIGNCINLSKIYHRVNWQIIFLLAGMIPLGVAMNNTGSDVWLSEQLLGLLQGLPNYLILGSLFGITMLLSGFISNNATAVILSPIAISLAVGLDLDVKPFLLAVMFAANFSFFTPMGYQTNTLIYGTGNYRMKHFLIIGGLLSVVLLIVATLILSTLL